MHTYIHLLGENGNVIVEEVSEMIADQILARDTQIERVEIPIQKIISQRAVPRK